MTRLWFVMPVHGREQLTRICLRQLARTCEAAAHYGIDATAAVIGEGNILPFARKLGFATVNRDNTQLGRKFNDGYQLACDPRYNPDPADYVVPIGSDDWIDPVILQELPCKTEIGVFKMLAVVNEDRTRLMRLKVPYPGGAGIRIIPRELLEPACYRPAEEDRNGAIDGSTLKGIRQAIGRTPPMRYLDVHDLQIVDWKTRGEQLHDYRELSFYRGHETTEPFHVLAAVYPRRALSAVRRLG